MSAGREHSLFLTGNITNEIKCWSVNFSHSCVASGRVLACGDNNHGQLGDGTRIQRRTLVFVMRDGLVDDKRAVKVVAARSHSLAIAGRVVATNAPLSNVLHAQRMGHYIHGAGMHMDSLVMTLLMTV